MPKRRAASRWLSPSTWQAWRTLPYSSTENIPRLPARSDRAQGRHQGGTVWHRRGRDTQPAVSEGHFLTAAYTRALSVGGTTGSGVLRGRPGQRFTTGAAAAAAGGVAETDGSAGAAGS